MLFQFEDEAKEFFSSLIIDESELDNIMIAGKYINILKSKTKNFASRN